METLLNCDLGPPPIKTAIPHYSPTFLIPGSCSSVPMTTQLPEPSPTEETTPPEVLETKEEERFPDSPPLVEQENAESFAHQPQDDIEPPKEEEEEEEDEDSVKPEMFYTPDEEEKVEEEGTETEEIEKCESYDVVESTNYVPPFNNPVYPNSSFTTFGSVMGRYLCLVSYVCMIW